jgi:hypothetical protein
MATFAKETAQPLFELPSHFVDVVVDILCVLKVQQLNIELLWKAHSADAPDAESLAQMRESNLRLASSMEKVAGILSAQIGLSD